MYLVKRKKCQRYYTHWNLTRESKVPRPWNDGIHPNPLYFARTQRNIAALRVRKRDWEEIRKFSPRAAIWKWSFHTVNESVFTFGWLTKNIYASLLPYSPGLTDWLTERVSDSQRGKGCLMGWNWRWFVNAISSLCFSILLIFSRCSLLFAEWKWLLHILFVIWKSVLCVFDFFFFFD